MARQRDAVRGFLINFNVEVLKDSIKRLKL